MKPKFNIGDKVKIEIDVTINKVHSSTSGHYYHISERNLGAYLDWSPNSNEFDKKSKLVKVTPKKKSLTIKKGKQQ